MTQLTGRARGKLDSDLSLRNGDGSVNTISNPTCQGERYQWMASLIGKSGLSGHAAGLRVSWWWSRAITYALYITNDHITYE